MRAGPTLDALERAERSGALRATTGMIHHFYCMGGAISYAQRAIGEAGATIAQALALK